MSSQNSKEIVFFHYPFSPWARKIIAYLSFRGIQYSECIQPVTMPRPDLKAMGVTYRRIPVMSIGRDFYCDTLLIFEKLEELFPGGDFSAKKPEQKALEQLLEKWTQVVVFNRAAEAIPTDLDVMKDKGFQDDREDLWGRSWKEEEQNKLIPEALVYLRNNFEFLENVLLSDGRKFVLGTDEPKLSDLHAVWIFDWLIELELALPERLINEKKYPKTFAWRNRWNEALAAAKKSAPKPKELEGSDAIKQILADGFGESEKGVDDVDPMGLKKGDLVEAYPIDFGFNSRDKGKLVSLDNQQAVVATQAEGSGTEVRVHHPRFLFRVAKVGA